MKIEKKTVAISLAIAIFIMLNIFSTFQLFFLFRYSDNDLHNTITDYFKSRLNKAVKFEEAHINFLGNIVLQNFDISVTTDFNDNTNFISSDKTVISLDFFELLHGNLTIDEIDFYNSEITFIKKYGKSYRECLNQTIDYENLLERLKNKSENSIIFLFHSAKLYYIEYFRDTKLTQEIYDISARINIDSTFSYDVIGYLKPYKSSFIRQGSILIRGTANYGELPSMKNSIYFHNFDLSFFNDYFKEYEIGDITLSGGLTADLVISTNKSKSSVRGEIETNDLSIVSTTEKFDIISNENIDININLEMDQIKNRYSIKELNLKDGIISVSGSGMYEDNDDNQRISLNISSNTIDLSDLSQNLSPFKDITYGGDLSFEGTFFLDMKKNTAFGTRFKLDLDDFFVKQYRSNRWDTLVDGFNGSIAVNDSGVIVALRGNSVRTDFQLNSKTAVSSWEPFKSDTAATIYSRTIDSGILFNIISKGISSLYRGSYQDKKRGYEDIFFLQKPIGKFVNNNDLAIELTADSIVNGKKAKLHNLGLLLTMRRGVLGLDKFDLQGYDASYNLRVQGFFNTDRPFVKVEGTVDDFNLTGFAADSGMMGSISGTVDIDYQYELSAFRLSNILENSRGRLYFFINSGTMKESEIQRMMKKFFYQNGYQWVDIDAIDFNTIQISVSQLGENFFINNFNLTGSGTNFNGRGLYTFRKGIQMPLRISVARDKGYEAIPLQIYGKLLSPCVNFSNPKNFKETCF